MKDYDKEAIELVNSMGDIIAYEVELYNSDIDKLSIRFAISTVTSQITLLDKLNADGADTTADAYYKDLQNLLRAIKQL